MPELRYHDLGRYAYQEAYQLQQRHFEQLLAEKKAQKDKPTIRDAGVLLLCEHDPVYTIGRNGDESNLIVNKAQLGAEVHRIGRGGDITYHGPGQLVGYPVLDLEKWPLGLAAYVFRLEEAILNTLKQFGIEAERTTEAPGVWLDYDDPKRARKICALGIQASRWVTMHGFALNVNTDLHYFNHIIPCGIVEKQVTSMEKELGEAVPMHAVKQAFREAFQEAFQVKWISKADSPVGEI